MDNFKFNFLSRNSKLFKLKQEFTKALNVFPLLRELLKTTPCRKIVLYILIGGTELIVWAPDEKINSVFSRLFW